LAGVDYLLPLYRNVSDYKYLMEKGSISGNPEDRQPEDLQAEGWKIVNPHFKKSQQAAVARYRLNQRLLNGHTGRRFTTIQQSLKLSIAYH
jgi:hypothetical protein